MNMAYTFLIYWGLVTQNSSARVICTDIWAIIWVIQHQLTKQRWWKLLNLTHQELAKFPEQKTANLCAYLTRHAISSMVIEVLWNFGRKLYTTTSDLTDYIYDVLWILTKWPIWLSVHNRHPMGCSWVGLFGCFYTPAQWSWRRGILDSPCPSVHLSVRLSICL